MIIWGSRGMASTVEEGQFHCPSCSVKRNFRLKQTRNWFTLYFIPIIPLNVLGQYVECGSCGGTFAEEIRSYDPEMERKKTEEQMLRVMILAALADGSVDPHERACIKKQFFEFSGLPVPDSKIDMEIELARQANATLNSFLAANVKTLNTRGKALVVKLAFETMSASGELAPGHQKELGELAKTLGIPEDQYRELIAHISEQ